MDFITLFEKLHEHEMELKRMTENEEDQKKKKNLPLKVKNFKEMDSKYEDFQNESGEDTDSCF